MTLRVAVPDLISPSYFPLIAAVELGFFERQGLDATIELVFPVTETFVALRDGDVQYVGGAAHAPLYAFPGWRGCRLLCALSQHMYWFLVVRSDVDAERGQLTALRGLRIGAAAGPVDGLRRMLREAGIDPDDEVDIGPVPGTSGVGVSFGVTAARALSDGHIDGFWANGMGAEVAVLRGDGRILVDVRRGDGPPGARDYTFPALVAAEQRMAEHHEEGRAAVRAVVAAQRALQDDPSLAATAATMFPADERALIPELIRRDAPFYDPRIGEETVASLNAFAADLGVLDTSDVGYDDVVEISLRSEWTP